jgi:hypothetical protein
MKKRTCFLIIFLFLYALAYSQKDPIPFEKDGKWGYEASKGKVIVWPEYDIAGYFNGQPLAPVRKGEKGAYINRNGEIASDWFEGDLSEFDPQGFGAVFSKGKTGRIDKTGKLFTGWVDEIMQTDNSDYFLAKNEEKFALFHPCKGLASEWMDQEPVVLGNFLIYKSVKGYLYEDINTRNTIFVLDKRPLNCNGLILIESGNKYNLLNKYGTLIFEDWAESIEIVKDFDLTNFYYSLVKINGKWMFIGDNGDIDKNIYDDYFYWNINPEHYRHVWSPEHYKYYSASEPRLMVKKENKWICLNERLKKEKLGFKDVYQYSDGLSRQFKNGKFGYINEIGDVVIPFQYSYSKPFSEGLAMVIKDTIPFNTFADISDAELPQNAGYIDNTGKTVIEFKYRSASDFHNGLAKVALCLKNTGTQQSSSYYYNNNNLNWISSYDCIYSYSLIDRNGNTINGKQYNSIGDFSEGKAWFCDSAIYDKEFRTEKPLFGYINYKGETIIEPGFNFSGDFSGGLALVGRLVAVDRLSVPRSDKVKKLSNRYKMGFINEKGEEVIKLTFDKAKPFSEGLAVVGKIVSGKPEEGTEKYKYGFINPAGDLVIDYLYDNAGSFSAGRASVQSGSDDSFYVDKTGKRK